MARARRFSVRQSPRAQKRGFKWDRNIIVPAALAAGAQADIVVVAKADYQGNINVSPSGVTMRRCIVDIALGVTQAEASEMCQMYWALFVVDSDVTAASISPNDGQELTDERVLATGVIGWVTNVAPATSLVFPHIHIDTKQGVKLRDADVRLTISNEAGGPTVQFHGTISVLLQGDVT